MARESVKILQGKLDVESLISQLNAALAEEWLAYYQYWVGALVVEGAMRADVQGEFKYRNPFQLDDTVGKQLCMSTFFFGMFLELTLYIGTHGAFHY